MLNGHIVNPKRWRALCVLALVQFMLVLDITVVNVALPSIKNDLGFTQSGLAWVVNGYTLMAGGLLLLGGRLADVLGRRRLFLAGLAVFALGSLSCGLAHNAGLLIASRFVQGTGEALAAPAGLGLVALLFPDPRERVKALGVWGGVAALGGTSGTVISGALTGLASWRWIFLVNIPVALVALVLVPRLVAESRMDRSAGTGRARVDVLGPLTATAGLIAIVHGLLQAATHAWGSSAVLAPLAGGVALLLLFVAIEARTAEPLIPLRFFTNRTRVATNFVSLFSASAFFSYFFLLTLYMQQVLHLTPLRAGLAYLPFGFAIGAGMGLSRSLMLRYGVRPLLAIGFFGTAVGLLLTSGITPAGGYFAGVLPGMVVMGIFSGISFPGISTAAVHQVTGQDASLAAGVQGAMQQVGGAIGVSGLVAFALQHAASQLQHGAALGAASTSGYVLAFRIGAALLTIGGVLVLALVQRVRFTDTMPGMEISTEPEPAVAAAAA